MLQRYVPRFPYLPCRKVTDKNRPDLRPTMHSNRCNRRDRTLNFIVCAQKIRKKKRKKEKKKKGKIHTGGTEMWRIGWRRKWLYRDYRGNEELCCKRVVPNYVGNNFICVWYRFFYLLSRDKVSKISIFSKFSICFFWPFMYKWSYDLIVKWEMEDRCERMKFQKLFSISFFLFFRQETLTRWTKIEIYIEC